ncbi:MAG: hypothetical protein LBO76_07310, partial [Treponema sp.]|nr:hypothetical protein [Treponema sp.]
MRLAALFLVSQFFMAPDDAGGGGSSGGIPPGDWIKRLNEAAKKDRKAIVEEMAKTLGVKLGDAYKMLKEAGWDPRGNNDKNFNNDSPLAAGERPGHGTSALPDDTPTASSPSGGDAAAGGVTVTLRHKSPYPHYRRAGLLLTKQWKPYTVVAAQLAVLKEDSWVEIQLSPGSDKEGA